MKSHHILSAFLVLVFTIRAQGPDAHVRVTNNVPATSGQFGTEIFALSDRDADGFDDYAVAAPSGPYPVSTGEVHVVSGRTGVRIRVFAGDQVLSRFGEAVAGLSDINGDGVPDLAVGAHEYNGAFTKQGRVFAFSGATGAVIWIRDGVEAFGLLGRKLYPTIDVTGDGVPDLLASEQNFGADNRGRVRVLNAATGVPVGDNEGSFSSSSFGIECVARGGVAYAADNIGRIFALLPSMGTSFPSILHTAPAAPQEPELALIANPTGGFDLLVGRRFEDPSGTTNGGTATLYLGGIPTTTPFFTLAGSTISELVGLRAETARDLDGNGEEELLIVSDAPGIDTIRARAYSRAGALILDQLVTGSAARFASIADVTGDGRGEWLVGVLSGTSSLAESQLWSRGLSVASWSNTTSGVTASFVLDFGTVHAGRAFVTGYGVSGSSPGIVLPGAPLIPLNIDALTLFIWSNPTLPVVPITTGTLDTLGRATLPFSLPPDIASALANLSLTLTAISLSGSAIAAAANPLLLPL